MRNKRKSMDASDAHAYKLRRSVAADLICDGRVLGMLP